MRVRYRFVPYGTAFQPCDGARPATDFEAKNLYRNEIAADVGGVFWPDSGSSQLPVIDHHFARTDQFPSATAAVLHSTEKVAEWWNRATAFEEVWLVTHVNPDFDAYASLYLIRSLEQWRGLKPMEFRMTPDAWRNLTPAEVSPIGAARFDWFSSPSLALNDEIRWRIFLGIVASYSDACKQAPCPKTQTGIVRSPWFPHPCPTSRSQPAPLDDRRSSRLIALSQNSNFGPSG
jgi:hypothetical protein